MRAATATRLITGLLTLALSLTLALLSLLTLALLALLTLALLALLSLTLLTLGLLTLLSLALLALLALLIALASTVAAIHHALDEGLRLGPDIFEIVHRVLRLLSAVGAFPSFGRGLLSILQIVAKLVEGLGHRSLPHHHRAALAEFDVLLRGLHTLLDFILLRAAGGIAELLCDIGLRTTDGSRGLLELLLQVGIVLSQISLLIRELLLSAFVGLAARAEGAAHLLFEILLLLGEAIGAVGEVSHLAAGLLLLHVLHRLIGGLDGIRSALRILGCLAGVLLTAGGRIAHGALRLLDLAHDLIELALLALAQAALAA